MTKNIWELTVEEDSETGNLILPIPNEILERQGWKNGDELEWVPNEDGSWTLQKVS
jgi:bifunctional DNA-binding transcriptional regulator/antitoxin component of YhaV-PrlF toxin-antitoxin module